MSTEIKLIGFYRNRSVTDATDLQIDHFFDGIKTGADWKSHVEWVREPGITKDEYNRRKSLSACVTIGGTFQGKKEKENLQQASGLIAMDIDHLGDEVKSKKRLLAQDGFMYGLFESIGGKGLCAIFKIADPTKYKESFDAISQYLIENYGLVASQVDPSSCNINRLRYVSYDPDIYVNYKAKVFTKCLKKEPKKTTPKTYIHTETDIEYILTQIDNLAVDIAPGYHDWYRAGWSLISVYGESARDLFHRISRHSSTYDEAECTKKFNYLIATKPTRITISTFYYLCKQAGIDILTPETRNVLSVAAMAKKQRIKKTSAVDMVLKQVPDVTPELANAVVNQVYESPDEFDTEETLFDQLESFLTQNYSLQYNEITHYIEDNHVPILDRGLNDIYVSAAKVFNMKVSKDNVFTLLLSGFVAGYNPVKSFFIANQHRKPFGVIDALCDTIKHDMGGTFVHFFLRKFLIGLISTVYGEQCPLVPILTGGKNIGKTQFWRRLLPDELKAYYAETTFRKEGDDEMLMCKRILIMNDDFDSEFLSKHARFKSLTDKHTFTVRQPYAKAHEDIPRLAVIAGTSNEDNLLSDPTGNRRIIPINVLSIDHAAYNEINKTDLLMEAYWLYQEGHRSDLTTEDIAYLEQHTSIFIDISTERDLIEKYFDIPDKKQDAMLWSQGEILVYLSQATGLKNIMKKRISQEMKAMGFPYSDAEYYKPEGRSKRGFWLYQRSQTFN